VKKSLCLAASLLVVVALLVGGCAGHPEGMKSLRWLTDAEKDKVIEIALNTHEAKKAREEYGAYETHLSWVAIVWDSSEYEYSEWRGIDYDWETDENLKLVTPTAEFYSRVVINFGEPPQWQVMVAVNPDTGKVVLVQENPFRTGPTPPR
jgi:hypothetical protein